MTPEHWSRVRALLEKALEVPEKERGTFLDNAEEDTQIVAEARRLLSFEQQVSGAFSVETWQGRAARTAVESDLSSTVIGSYRLEHELGRGGMGTVYLASRADGAYEQQVAVKVLQENIFSESLARRFRDERQILAQLTHPGIVRLLDGGVLSDGRPYLVLEYVDGIPIDQYCVEHALSREACLRLFARVADVVQAAHQQLVLHLDLKPANILVTAQGEPRLLDFGLARFVSENREGSEATIRLLTPRYASPEQASGERLSVASDVFSLGTLLYRLLTGTLPYPIQDASPLEAIRILNSTAPTPPSQVAPELKGDLDTIVLHALRKEPGRRYPTVAAFREDVLRYLESRPVLARADSLRYRLGRFIARNRVSVTLAACTVCVLIVSVVMVVRSASTARMQRGAAERRLRDIQDLARFYTVDLFAALNDIPGTLPVRKEMTANAVKYLQSMASEREGDPKYSLDLANGLFEMAKVQGFPNQPSLSDLHGAQNVLALARAMVELHARQMPNDPANHAREGLLLASQANLSNALGDVRGAIRLEERAWQEVQPVLQGPKSGRWMQIATYCFFNAVYLAREEQFSMADPATALLWLDRGETLLLDLGRAKPEYLVKALYITQLAQVRFTKGEMLGKLHRDREAVAYFTQGMRDVDAQSDKDTIEIAKHKRDAHRLYAQFLLARGEVAKAAEVFAMLRPKEQQETKEGAGSFDQAEYGASTWWWALLRSAEGHKVEAQENMDKSLRCTRALYLSAPEDQTLVASHVIDLITFAEMPGIGGQRSRTMLLEALPLVSQFNRAQPGITGAQMLEARAHLDLAHLYASEHKVAEQQSEATQAKALLVPVLQQHPTLQEPAELFRAAQDLSRI